VMRTAQTGGALVSFGQSAQVASTENATISALSDRDTTATAIAGAGGLAAVNAGEGTLNHTSSARVDFADATSTDTGADIDALDNLTVAAVNQDTYDSSLDAGASGVAGATGGVLRATGSAATEVDFGNYADIDARNLTVNATNNLAKTGYNDNFKFDGGGAISVTVGDSRASQTQTNRIDLGAYSDIAMAGSGSNKGGISLNALTDVTAHDDMTLNTGALVGVPVSDTKVTANATTGIYVGDNRVVGNILCFEGGDFYPLLMQ